MAAKRVTVAAIVLVSLVLAVPASAAPRVTHRLVLIVAGQSNASGLGSFAKSGSVDYLSAPYATAADRLSRITWDQSYLSDDLKSTEVPLDTAQTIEADAPVPLVSGAQVFGPEIGLARAVYASTGRPVTIIKVAFGNTVLAGQWIPGGPLWNKMVTFVHSTIARDATAGQKDTIGGFYWMQGEDDAAVPGWASRYQTNLISFVLALRHDLLGPHPPIVLAKIWDPTSAGNTEVRDADGYVAAHHPNVFTVDTKNLPRLPDQPHLTNVGELTLGKMMADAS
jgi:hypothetical protein